MSVADLIPYVILACCVHNLCLEGYNENIDDFIEEGTEHVERNSTEQNQSQRLTDEFNEEMIYNDSLGSAKRNYLAALIA